MIKAEQIKSLLNLKPLPEEGGFFAETHRSDEYIPKNVLSDRYKEDRTFATAIYYLLTPDTFSAMHRLPTEEIFHFYLGNPVEMLQLSSDGSGKIITIGTDIQNGMQPQVIVPKGTWQGTRLLPGFEFALLGTTMSPGFEFADYESGERNMLIESYPEFRDLITALTR